MDLKKDIAHSMPLVNLIGDPEENFYQLGLKDREHHGGVLAAIESQVQWRGKTLNNLLKTTVQSGLRPLLSRGEIFSPLLKAYSEGLGRPYTQVAYALIIPEVLSGFSGIKIPWAFKNLLPKTSSTTMGCSSFFCLDPDGRPIHGRILDFPLLEAYDQQQRAMITQFKHRPAIFSLGATGLPYPSLTAMNAHGVTLALHQKFTNIFSLKGRSIFEIAFELLNEAHTPESAMRFIRRSTSITGWGINMCFANGQVVLCDILGEDAVFKEITLKPGTIIYTNNLPIKKTPYSERQFPPGIIPYCAMRERVAMEKIKIFGEKKKEQSPTDFELLQLMSTPLLQKHRTSQHWDLDNLTPSTLTVSCMMPSLGSTLVLAGNAPKIYSGKAYAFRDIWGDCQQSFEIGPTPRYPNMRKKMAEKKKWEQYHLGLYSLMQSQRYFDHGDMHQCYHAIQMAKVHFEQESFHEAVIAEFFFQVFQFLFEKHRKVRFQILENFKILKEQLPTNLKEHCILFILRSEKILLGKTLQSVNELSSPTYKSVWLKEKTIPSLLLLQTIKTLIRPRVDIVDVVYLHGR